MVAGSGSFRITAIGVVVALANCLCCRFGECPLFREAPGLASAHQAHLPTDRADACSSCSVTIIHTHPHRSWVTCPSVVPCGCGSFHRRFAISSHPKALGLLNFWNFPDLSGPPLHPIPSPRQRNLSNQRLRWSTDRALERRRQQQQSAVIQDGRAHPLDARLEHAQQLHRLLAVVPFAPLIQR